MSSSVVRRRRFIKRVCICTRAVALVKEQLPQSDVLLFNTRSILGSFHFTWIVCRSMNDSGENDILNVLVGRFGWTSDYDWNDCIRERGEGATFKYWDEPLHVHILTGGLQIYSSADSFYAKRQHAPVEIKFEVIIVK